MEKNSKNRYSLPIGLSIISVVALVYVMFHLLLVTGGLFFSAWVTNVLNEYSFTDYNLERGNLVFLLVVLWLLLAASLSGVIMIRLMKRAGFYIFTVSMLVLFAVRLSVAGQLNWLSASFGLLLIVLFGLYLRRMGRNKAIPE